MATAYEFESLFPKRPDARADGEAEAARLTRAGWTPDVLIDRTAADAPALDRRRLLAGVTAFHQERMTRTPDPARYPESTRWVDYVRQRDQAVQDRTGMSAEDLAVLRSLNPYMAFRGWQEQQTLARGAQPTPTTERCRVVYLADSTLGETHFKNVDDPLAGFEPRPAPRGLDRPPLVYSGVGSGLHLDTEPDELFPLSPLQMMLHETEDAPGAVAFLGRYRSFWGGCNIVVYDRAKRAAAIEKTSYCHMDVYEQNAAGSVHVSGMVCRDAANAHGRHQTAMRQRYMTMFGLPEDGPDRAFWDACDRAERMLADALNDTGHAADGGPIDARAVWRLLTTPWPEGLSKEGAALHPDQAVREYTLASYAFYWEKQRMLRLQRDPQTGNMPEAEEVYQF